MNFPNQECPLCKKTLQLTMLAGVRIYKCPTETISHYELESDGKEAIQHMYAFPYAIDNFINSNKSRLYKWNDVRWQFIKEVPRIKGDLQQNILQKILEIVS